MGKESKRSGIQNVFFRTHEPFFKKTAVTTHAASDFTAGQLNQFGLGPGLLPGVRARP